ncbi:MAG: 4Fe-4S binding protein, partial [Rubrivivax sp.]|nr:4Fe-4S binding protein [Rubrivivax sp.]
QHWRKHAVLHDAASCTACSLCAAVCPFHAIRLKRTTTHGGRGDSAGS